MAYGPARAAKGYARVDEIDITSFLKDGENLVQVYVQSCRTATLCFPCEEPLFGAEISADGKIVKTTADFKAYEMTDKLRKVERMSSHRGYLEIYDGDMRGETDVDKFQTLTLKEVTRPKLLQRNVRFALNEKAVATLYETGGVSIDDTRYWENDFMRLFKSEEKIHSYTHEQCEYIMSRDLMRFVFDKNAENVPYRYKTYAFEKVHCGKFSLKLRVEKRTQIYLIYDDLLIDGYVKFNREQILHGLKWTLEKGEYELYSGEVYEAKYVAIVTDNEAVIDEVGMIKIENPQTDGFTFSCADKDLQDIVEAARNSFKHNCYDIPTDCPNRERAGWLCDGYFTSIAEKFLTGENLVEKNFLENYALFKNEIFAHDGILPMCYPSEPRTPSNYIPNWVMWFVIELDDCLKRTGDYAFVKKLLPTVRRILRFFEGYENEYGLLENLEGWVFVEWSKANEFTDGVNFPSNMAYAYMLECAGRLLKNEKLTEKSARLKKIITELSYDGTFFIDNAVRVDGKLVRTENISETCQNYAVFFGLLSRETGAFYRRLLEEFGCFRKEGVYENVYPSNMFIGYVLRLMILYREGETDRLLKECKQRFLEMARATGTIWELFQNNASCNHGFGSVLAPLIVYSTFGIKSVDTVNKAVTLGKHADVDATVTLPLGGTFARIEIKNGVRNIEFPKEYSVRLDG